MAAHGAKGTFREPGFDAHFAKVNREIARKGLPAEGKAREEQWKNDRMDEIL